MKIKSFIIFIILTLSSYCNAAEFYCDTQSKRNHLHFIDNNQKKYEIVDFNFHAPQYISKAIPCTFWLSNFYQFFPKTEIDSLIEIKPLISQTSIPSARLIGRTKAILYQYCSKHPICSIAFPYNIISGKYMLDIFQDFSSYTDLTQCFEPRKRIKKEAQLFSFDQIVSKKSKIDFFYMPWTTMTKQTLVLSKKLKANRLILSAMTFSDQFAHDIAALGITTKIFYSLPIRMLNQNYPSNVFQNKIDFIPVFSTPNEASSFHIKGTAIESENNNAVIFSTTNLRDYEKSKLIDLGFVVYNDKKYLEHFKKITFNVEKQLCENKEHLACNLYSRLPKQLKIVKKIISDFNARCSEVVHFPQPKLDKLSMTPKEMLIKLIRNSKKSIKVMSHMISDRNILAELYKAKSKKVDVKIISGVSKYSKLLKQHYRSMILYKAKKGFEPHGKFIISDNKNLLFGTGNFTMTGLSNTNEIFYLSQRKKMIHEFNKFFNSSYKFIANQAEATRIENN